METKVAIGRAATLFTAAVVVPLLAAAAGAAAVDCTRSCGNISIPYPFGVELGCYDAAWFNLTCDSSYRPPRLFLGDGTVQVLGIDLRNGTVRINGSVAYFPGGPGANNGTTLTMGAKSGTANGTWWSQAIRKGGPYSLARGRNKLLAVGCNVQVVLSGGSNESDSAACFAVCPPVMFDGTPFSSAQTDCSRNLGCCQTEIITVLRSYEFQVLDIYRDQHGPNSDTRAYIVDSESRIDPSKLMKSSPGVTLPAVLDWSVKRTRCGRNGFSAACRSSNSSCVNVAPPQQGHLCHCAQGYQGNPYIPNGCKDINECKLPDKYPCSGICKNFEGGYECKCRPGYEGNAFTPNGCRDIDECAYPANYTCPGTCINMPGTYYCQCADGRYWSPSTENGSCKSTLPALSIGLIVGAVLLFLALGVPFIIRKIKRHRDEKMKRRFFKQNHGLLLQQLVSQRSDIGGRMIVTLRDLEKATNNFDPSHEIGGGGHGVVFKGLLDLQVVAIKKSKIMVQREINDFVNEVAILSQINHRNVVKLLGCCLETEVPLLVYEFVSNGTLAHHLHVEEPILSWDDRLRISFEVSKALAYLHSATSTPILHRDIKSANILLDDNLTAKVSDFGASKYIPIDKTGVTTAVQGTIGYLDPMYYYTSRLTDKSDVFSFGVLLIELLTRKKPFVYLSNNGEGLVSHFASLLDESRLVEILDPQIMKDGGEQINGVAALAVKCTKLNGEDRPEMREIEMTLENLRAVTKQHAYHSSTTSRRRYDGDQTRAHYISSHGDRVETSRQYTMEEEMMFSSTYPR